MLEDHRPVGVFALRSGDEYVAVSRALVQLAPDAVLRAYHILELGERGSLGIGGWEGNREGGPFEIVAANVNTWDAEGRIRRIDVYALDQLAEARARYAELRPDPLRIPPNAATRQSDRWQAAFEAGDWDELLSLHSPEFVFEDRRPLFGMSGDRNLLLRSARLVAESAARVTRTVLATAGERLALERIRWARADDFEVEMLDVVEVDAEGRFSAHLWFDPDDRAAASRELFERSVRHGVVPPALAERGRAHLDHDVPRFRSLLPADFVFHDHRRAGAGRLENVEDFVAWTAGLFQESPDAVVEALYFLAIEPHGTLSVGHSFGTNRSGGTFESVFVSVNSPNHIEVFDLEDLDRARARFEELCAGPGAP
ncbi:MAG: hypothetical protein ACREI8_09575 [Myxococcota bacterium]